MYRQDCGNITQKKCETTKDCGYPQKKFKLESMLTTSNMVSTAVVQQLGLLSAQTDTLWGRG